MSFFTAILPDGKTLTGMNHFPQKAPVCHVSALPLIIAVHGGSYTSEYFDADENHTIRHISQSLGIPVIAINRPGYHGTTKLPETRAQSSFIVEQGVYLHKTILPFLWTMHASKLGAASIFLYAHSIGGAISVVAASLHGSETILTEYPLCGISISGVGSNVKPLSIEEFSNDPKKMLGISIRFPNDLKDLLMLGPPKLYDPAILRQTERLQHQITVEELYDINFLWRDYWRKYAAEVRVSVLYSIGEYDELWNKTDQDVKEFAEGFVKSPSVETRRLLYAPHCIEHSLQASGLILRTLGFAIECAVYCKVGEV